MPAWAINTQVALSSGDNLQCLLATEAIGAGGALKGFAFTPQVTPIVPTVVNNSGQTLVLEVSADNIVWTPLVIQGGAAVQFTSGSAASVTVGSGLNYRLANAVAIVAGGTVWVAR
jgi:hypothetical protein